MILVKNLIYWRRQIDFFNQRRAKEHRQSTVKQAAVKNMTHRCFARWQVYLSIIFLLF